MADITVIGSNMFELTTTIKRMPEEGETVEAPYFETGCGGKGANQAIAASCLGSDVNFITVIGDDDFGKAEIENYRQFAVNTEGIIRGHGASGVAPVFIDADGNNRILIVKGANNQLTPEILDQKIDLIHQAHMVLLQQEISLETNYHAIDLARQAGVPVLLNPAPANKNLNISQVTKVDFFTPNETELATLTNLPTDTMDEIKTASTKLIDLGLTNVIVTLGSKGALWMDKYHSELVKGLKVDTVDTTGAGDAFIGSFAHYYTHGSDVRKALQQANRFAAYSTTQRGTQKSYPEAARLCL